MSLSGSHRPNATKPARAPEPTEERLRARRGGATLDFRVLRGDEALDWMRTAENREAWALLYDQCPWSTAFFSSAFFALWCRNYAQLWSPLLVIGRRSTGALAGIMPLATRGGVVTGAGTHQAEYHGWLSTEEDAEPFGTGALDAVARSLPRHTLRLHYLPPGVPAAFLERVGENPRVTLTCDRSYEFAPDPDAIAKSLKKRGNKTKLIRLRRRGALEIRKLDADGFAAALPRIARVYDFRQGAMYGDCPFLDDPRKAAFHLDWIRTAPSQLHATVMTVDGRLASALLLVMSEEDAHLAISAHSPELAASSPMKFHLYWAALALADEGRRVVDLTPGGEWKERFSTDVRDVWELVLHRDTAHARLARARMKAKGLVRSGLSRVGLSVAQVRNGLHSVRDSARSSARRVMRAHGEDVLYRLDPTRFAPAHGDLRVERDDLDALMRRAPAIGRRSRQAFLRLALGRLEAGMRCYAVIEEGRPVCLGWLSAPPERRIHDVTFTVGQASARRLSALVACAVHDTRDSGEGGLFAAVSERDAMLRDCFVRLGFVPTALSSSG
jgi:CelD/BcsL family acetyltransferase involved in cellulose biosynthesis